MEKKTQLDVEESKTVSACNYTIPQKRRNFSRSEVVFLLEMSVGQELWVKCHFYNAPCNMASNYIWQYMDYRKFSIKGPPFWPQGHWVPGRFWPYLSQK